MVCPYEPFDKDYKRVFVYCESGRRSPVIRDIERLEKKDRDSAEVLRAMIQLFEEGPFQSIPQNYWRRLGGECNLEIRPLRCKKVLRVLAIGYPPRRFEKFIVLDIYEAHGGKRQQIDPDTLKQANKRARECLGWLRKEEEPNEKY